MFYVVANGKAYALDHSGDIPYTAPILSDGVIDWDQAYDVVWDNYDEEEQEYIAHVCYHLQQIVKLSEEHQEVFVK
jgi:hypothetical protein